MRIGLDFDNTIVSYDKLFQKIAVEHGYVPPGFTESKLAVRDHLRAQGKEAVWVEMQGYVYGARMMEAELFPHVLEFLQHADEQNIETIIVSHKTQHPFVGPAYDLHGSARQWIAAHLNSGGRPVLPPNRIFFELTKEEKLARIAACDFDIFVDDLPEILMHPAFPVSTLRVLFDPTGRESVPETVRTIRSWAELRTFCQNAPCTVS